MARALTCARHVSPLLETARHHGHKQNVWDEGVIVFASRRLAVQGSKAQWEIIFLDHDYCLKNFHY